VPPIARKGRILPGAASRSLANSLRAEGRVLRECARCRLPACFVEVLADLGGEDYRLAVVLRLLPS